MRITFVVPILEVSGGARIIAGHAQRLAERGHEILIVARRLRRLSFKDRAKAWLRLQPAAVPTEQSHVALAGVPVKVVNHWGPVREQDVPDADVIIATWWETAEWIWPFSPAKGAKVHFIQHYEAFPELPVERVDAVWRLPLSKIAVAQWLVDLGRERFGIGQMALVPNSVDHHFFNATPRPKGEPPTVGFLFHEVPFKDLPTTIAVAQRLKEISPEVRFLSFGASRPRSDQLPPNTKFHYLPSQAKIAEIYRRCDAWLSTSRTEGFNLPPLEAMACGCPAVCAKTGRPLEIIENGVNGYLVEQGDVAGFADALLSILVLSNSAWREMSQATVRAVAHPNWEESSDLFERALIRAVGDRDLSYSP
jgi:glycosyltransferase involved in cell wall biosynthesis